MFFASGVLRLVQPLTFKLPRFDYPLSFFDTPVPSERGHVALIIARAAGFERRLLDRWSRDLIHYYENPKLASLELQKRGESLSLETERVRDYIR